MRFVKGRDVEQISGSVSEMMAIAYFYHSTRFQFTSQFMGKIKLRFTFLYFLYHSSEPCH